MRLSSQMVKRRILLMLVLMLLAIAGLVGRLSYIQLFQNHFFIGKAMDQRLQAIPVDARRGTIYDRNGIPLAMSISANAVYVIPAQVREKEKTSQLMSQILNLDYEFVYKRVSKRSSSEWIKKRVTLEETQKILALNLQGVGIVENPERFYPYGSIAPQVLGLVGIDNQGLEGIELFYDKYLRGQKGKTVFERDAVGREIPDGIRGYLPGEDGADLVLTLDYYIQQIAQREVERAALETGSRLAVIIITDPKSGEILATAIYPNYDILNFMNYPVENRKNIAVTDTYEPGSTFKAITAAIALESGVVNMNTHFFDPGFINVSGWTIRCWNRGGHGSQNFVETLENSCNPFYAKIGMDLGGERFYEYLNTFNYGSRLGVDFPGEAPGTLRAPSKSIPLVTWANIGFGQGMTITPLQLMAGFGAIANNGILAVPHYVKEIHVDGQIFPPDIPEPRQVLSTEIARMTRDALRSVIANGSGQRADAEGFLVAGKTGTAQLVENGRYSHSKTVTSFAGFAPYNDPVMAGMIVMWEPQGAFFGGIIAAPVFSRLAEQILPYMGVERQQTKAAPGVPRPREIVIPDVVGLGLNDASNQLRLKGLGVEVVGEGSRIVGQVPAANAKVNEGTLVLIYTDLDYLQTFTEIPNPFGV